MSGWMGGWTGGWMGGWMGPEPGAPPPGLSIAITAFTNPIVEGVQGTVESMPGGGTPPYQYTWSATKVGGGGDAPTFGDPNAQNTTIVYPVKAGQEGDWTLQVDVQDADTNTAQDTATQTVQHVATDAIATSRPQYDMAIDGQVVVSCSINGSDQTGAFDWSKVGGTPAGTLVFTPNNSNAARTSTLTAGAGVVEDTYTIQVQYNNGRDTPVTAQATLVVHEAGWIGHTAFDMNDLKNTTLCNRMGVQAGKTDDLEVAWLNTQPGVTSGDRKTAWFQMFDNLTVPGETWNQRAFNYLGTQGHVQPTLNARWASYWETG